MGTTVKQQQETTALQEAFALHFVMNGGNGADAVRKAGFNTKHPNSIAHQLLNKRHVQEAIRQEQFKRLNGSLASLALSTLEGVMSDPEAPAGARVQAAVAVLERGGFSARNPVNLNQPPKDIHDMSNAELAEFISMSRRVLEQYEQTVKAVDGELLEG